MVSFVLHTGLLLTLGLIATSSRPGSPGVAVVATIGRGEPEELLDELEWELAPVHFDWVSGESIESDHEVLLPEVELPSELDPALEQRAGSGVGLQPSHLTEPSVEGDLPVGGGLEGRGAEARARLVLTGGGTPVGEAAIDRGLRWLAAYQRDDGSWNFDHNKGRQSGFCRNPGTVASTTGATAIALAPFLGRGITHLGGEHKETVRRGLYYLRSRAMVTPDGIDLQEGTMYAQGLSTIVLCEAYAMTHDPQLRKIAQASIDFIDHAQNKRGGWRYTPGEPGDTTVTGWQLMALKSGQLANLNVRSPSVVSVSGFLDRVSSENGARYGYLTPEPRRTTTAIGLLCRMYLGWPRSHTGLRRGVAYLSEWGPSSDNMYYNYYATQVLRHWGGPEWERWNPKMREFLIATQSNAGYEAGSWYFSGGHGEAGGRLYNTAMAIMTLEVYYRYMPLYQSTAFEAETP